MMPKALNAARLLISHRSVPRRNASTAFVILVSLGGCTDSPIAPTISIAHMAGSYAAVRAFGTAIEQVCSTFLDPPGSGLLAVGVLSIDTVRNVVRRQERRATGSSGCSKEDTVHVDVERPYRISGRYILIQRPVESGRSVEDTATLLGETLVLRLASGNSYYGESVYERVSSTEGVFFANTPENPGWMIGGSSFSNTGQAWTTTLDPAKGPRNQRINLSSAARPTAGEHTLGSNSSLRISIARDTPGGSTFYQSTSGSVFIAESTPQRVQGRIDAVLTSTSGAVTTRLTGTFTTVCRGAC
jgi:hypothetical protein